MSLDVVSHDVLTRVAAATATQPPLFSEDPALELESGVVDAARRLFGCPSAPQHTGKISTNDERLATAVLLCLQAGMSRRQIREKVSVHHYTIDRIEKAAEAGGKLEPLNTRIREQLSRLVLDAVHETRESIQAPVKDVAAAAWLKSVATALGIGTDKHQLLTGAPTEILEHRSGPGRVDLEEWLASNGLQVVAPAAAVDVQSPADAPKPLIVNGSENLPTGQTTDLASVPTPGGAVGPVEDGGRGGSSTAGRPTEVDGSSGV